MSSAQYAQLAQQAVQQASTWQQAVKSFKDATGMKSLIDASSYLSPYWQQVKATKPKVSRGTSPRVGSPSRARSPRASSPRGVTWSPQLTQSRTSGQSAYPSQYRAWQQPGDGVYSQYGWPRY